MAFERTSRLVSNYTWLLKVGLRVLLKCLLLPGYYHMHVIVGHCSVCRKMAVSMCGQVVGIYQGIWYLWYPPGIYVLVAVGICLV